MSTQDALPIFEDDLAEPGVIEASHLHQSQRIAPVALLCFFNDLLVSLAERNLLIKHYTLRSEIGSNHIYELAFDGQVMSVLHPGVGSPLAVGFVEEAIAVGISTFVACGGAGALDPRFDAGHLMVVEGAVRDEGTSMHYARPARVMHAQSLGVQMAHDVLEKLEIEHVLGRVWTTDAMFRETRSRVRRRVAEGCYMVDMEASALIALARYREVRLAHVLYAGDLVVGEEWDSREWDKAASVRESLFWASARIALALHRASPEYAGSEQAREGT